MIFLDTTQPNPRDEWRRKLFPRFMTMVLVLAWCAGAPLVLMIALEGQWVHGLLNGVSILLVTWLYFNRKGNATVLSLSFLALLFWWAVESFTRMGLMSLIYLMALPFSAVMLLSFRAAIGALFVGALTLSIAAYFSLESANTLFPRNITLKNWADVVGTYVMVSLGLMYICEIMLRDIDDRIKRQQEAARLLHHATTHDALTNLPNRAYLHERLTQELARGQRNGGQIAVLVLDVDHFKHINDSLGHAVGDQLIQAIGKRLNLVVGTSEPVCRMGGDEFAVLLTEVGTEATLLTAVQRTLHNISGEYVVAEKSLFVNFSAGVAVFPRDGQEADALIKHADAALFRAKEQGRHRFAFFQTEMNERLQERLSLEMALHMALKCNELELYFQPRVNALDGSCRGAEALMRWQHPEWGLLVPGRFIPVAEDSGLIVPIGEWVMCTAVAQLLQWQQKYPQMHLSINLSARELQEDDLRERIQAAMQGLRENSLEVEITESVMVRNLEESQRFLAWLQAYGVGVALDDFGTGVSSLAYLKGLPLDVLKIDKSFVDGVAGCAQDRAIVKAIVDLAASLKLKTVAEGVETAAQADVLRACGVDEMQGYWIARPMPADKFEEWLQMHCTQSTLHGERTTLAEIKVGR